MRDPGTGGRAVMDRDEILTTAWSVLAVLIAGAIVSALLGAVAIVLERGGR